MTTTTTTAAALAPAVTEPTLWLIPGLPLLGAALLLILGRRSDGWGHLLGCVAALASFGVALWQFAGMAGRAPGDRAVEQTLFTWVSVGELQVDFGLRLDQLSMVFVLLVTGVGLLIHVYSIGYMATDPARRKFFAYLNLFLAAMLMLVLADNFLGLYLGWEGVGLVSYLLIGFWQHKPSAATAAKKAFLVNRVGDIGLGVALMVMVTQLGTLSYDGVFAAIDGAGSGAAAAAGAAATGAAGGPVSSGLVTALGLLLLLGACAKSAQVPLQSWLGDAMEGPTPVSALIHAATMVTAGVYLIVRANPIFDATPAARTAVIVVGAVTLLFGAIIGCAKDDIKKVLAASTMSQVGYMVMAAGLGPAGYALAIMHLLTHGFFKAGLFLGAGSVMHGMNDQVDMRRYGALRTVMPITFVTFGLGYLAIIGVPPFSGFYSKEGIISAAFDLGADTAGAGAAGGYLLGAVALLGAGLTAFYMTRVMILTFFGPRRWDDDARPHESPPSMTGTMIVLAVGSVLSGLLLALGGRLEGWLAPVVGDHHAQHVLPVWLVTTMSLVVVAAGIAIAVRLYARREIAVTPSDDVSALTRAARRDLYADTLNESALMRPGQALVAATSVVDRRVVAGATGGVATALGHLSARTRALQSGLTRSYALYMLVGAVLIIAVMLSGGVL